MVIPDVDFKLANLFISHFALTTSEEKCVKTSDLAPIVTQPMSDFEVTSAIFLFVTFF